MYTMFGPLSSVFPQIAQKYRDIVDGSATWRVSKEPALFWSQLRPVMDHFVFNDPGFKLNVELVAAPGVSRTVPLKTNYISAIATAEIEPLKNHNIPGSSPRSMLYLLLRQATLLAMRRTASKFLSTEPGDLLEGYYNDDPSKIVWNRLNTPVAALQNRTLADVSRCRRIQTSRILHNTEAR
jgi:hypothetical protein